MSASSRANLFILIVLWALKVRRASELNDNVDTIDPSIDCIDHSCNSLKVTFDAFDESFEIVFERKEEVLLYVNLGEEFKKEDCYFLKGNPKSGVTVTVCDTIIDGIFKDGKDTFEIKHNDDTNGYTIEKITKIKGRALSGGPKACGTKGVVQQRSLVSGRDLVAYDQLYLSLLVVVDNANFKRFDGNHSMIADVVHRFFSSVNEILHIFKVNVSIAGFVFWEDKDEIEIDKDSAITLQRFSEWQNNTLRHMFPDCFRVAHLLTALESDGCMGIAYTKYACSPEFATSITWTRYTNFENVRATAHELSHNIGLNHDINGCECHNSTICVMASGDWGLGPNYSQCSINEFNTLTIASDIKCLTESLPICNNRTVESD